MPEQLKTIASRIHQRFDKQHIKSPKKGYQHSLCAKLKFVFIISIDCVDIFGHTDLDRF